MPGIISESYLSRPFTLGLTAGRELEFDIMDTDDEVEVYNLLVGPDGGPAAYLGLARESLEARPLGGGVWKGYVRYVNLVGTSEYTFDTGAARITSPNRSRRWAVTPRRAWWPRTSTGRSGSRRIGSMGWTSPAGPSSSARRTI